MMSSSQTHLAALQALPRPTLTQLFEERGRLDKFASRLDLPGGAILFDWSKTHLDDAHVEGFLALAEAHNFAERRASLFTGGLANPSEGLPAEHTALRGFGSAEALADAKSTHERMRQLVEAIHQSKCGAVRHLIHIGIGGSVLGPALAVSALGRGGLLVDTHFVSNIGGCQLEDAFAACDPSATMIVVASKTFTTVEALLNADTVLAWLHENGVADAKGKFIALTASPDKAQAWGVETSHILPFAKSVGGRYSLWSSIGFSVALALGWEQFAAMLAGAAAMDEHFLHTNGAANLPLRAAMADQLYASVRGCQTRAVFVYDDRLALFPSYLQQLEMESNGKGATFDGQKVSGSTAPVTWGGVGTDAQHAVFQLLHQGPAVVPVDFIAAIKPGNALGAAHHRTVLATCFAQGAALMAGQPSDNPVLAYPGDRPSATILIDALNAVSLGALIAFYEHRTFANAVLLNINPFDQFGVELGKVIAHQIGQSKIDIDRSTEMLLAGVRLIEFTHHAFA